MNRLFMADRPNKLWVSDFPYVPTWSGTVYVAFVIDVFARRIVGWRASTSIKTQFVQDAFGLVAVWCRSFDSVMCSKGDELWAQSGRMNFARMRCGSR
jgi:hypothetical protein